ncbi:MAG: hypothetical protein IPJ74_05940 [Saprospiraceae bacterium]|nr:hypothetical protein [Saprospiraceae bacterium]
MDAPLATFEPSAAGIESLSIIALIVFVACALGTFLLLRQRSSGRARNMNLVIAMLLFFVGMISLGTFIFNTLAHQRVGTVIIYADGIQLGKNKIGFANIENARIEDASQSSFVNPSIVTKKAQVLLISERNGKTYALSSEHYPLAEVMAAMRQALQQWEATSE